MDTEQTVTAEETTEQEQEQNLPKTTVPETAVSETAELPKKPKKKRGLKWLLFVVLFVLFAFAGFAYFYMVRPIPVSFTYELGEAVSEDLHDYIEGFDAAIEMSTIDISEIVQYPGNYQVYVHHYPFVYIYSVTIRDTKAPKIEGYSHTKAFKIGDSYSVDDVVDKVSDLDPIVKVEFENPTNVAGVEISDRGDYITFEEPMQVQLIVKAEDSSGNATRVAFTAISDTAPVIVAYEDYYVAKGTDETLYCKAYDEMDLDVTEDVVLDIKPDYYKTTGTYEGVFRAYDSLGLESDCYVKVHVYEPETIQDMINTDRINGLAENVVGAINPYDAGYVIEDNIEAAKDRLIPAIVRVSYETDYVRAFGSGYILKISDTGIIIGTNHHVVDEMSNVDIHFFDGTTVKGHVVVRSSTPDIAFVRVNLKDIRPELLKKLKTVHINLKYYETLSYKPSFELGMYCTDGEGGEWLTHYGVIERKSGWLEEYFADYSYAVTEVSVDLIPGVSGSMIFDSHGNFICMATFYWMNGKVKENYGVSLDSILNYYESVFGKRLEYN